jgi:hypothetical protein
MPVVANLIAFKFGWLACVLGGANELPWLGALVALVIVTAHVARAPLPMAELKLIVAAGLLGAFWDSVLASSGLLVYRSGTLIAGAAPYWIVAMWLLFSTTLNVSLTWLKGRLLVASAVGAVAGPLAFYGGHKLGAVDFGDFWLAMLALAAGWALILPALVLLSGRLNGFVPRGLAFEASTLGRRQPSGY